jgi:hypothetical protein
MTTVTTDEFARLGLHPEGPYFVDNARSSGVRRSVPKVGARESPMALPALE